MVDSLAKSKALLLSQIEEAKKQYDNVCDQLRRIEEAEKAEAEAKRRYFWVVVLATKEGKVVSVTETEEEAIKVSRKFHYRKTIIRKVAFGMDNPQIESMAEQDEKDRIANSDPF